MSEFSDIELESLNDLLYSSELRYYNFTAHGRKVELASEIYQSEISFLDE
jgi:hypothetical protein